MRKLMLYWFRRQASRAAKRVLASHFANNEIDEILRRYWQQYLKLKPDLPTMPTLGSSLMIHLSAMSTGFYQELISRGKSEETIIQLFYDIAWKVYQKMGRYSWRLAGLGNPNGYIRLFRATKLFRAFPFNNPAYQWKDVKTDKDIVGFDCLKCPVAEYFQSKGLSKFCEKTWCSLDFPLAEIWDSQLIRTGSIAGGASKCDFRWKVKPIE